MKILFILRYTFLSSVVITSFFEIVFLKPILQPTTGKLSCNFGLPVLSLCQPSYNTYEINEDMLTAET